MTSIVPNSFDFFCEGVWITISKSSYVKEILYYAMIKNALSCTWILDGMQYVPRVLITVKKSFYILECASVKAKRIIKMTKKKG